MTITTLDRVSISDEARSTRIEFGGIRFRTAVFPEEEICFSFGCMEKDKSQDRMAHAARIRIFCTEIGTTDRFVRIVGFIECETHDREICWRVLEIFPGIRQDASGIPTEGEDIFCFIAIICARCEYGVLDLETEGKGSVFSRGIEKLSVDIRKRSIRQGFDFGFWIRFSVEGFATRRIILDEVRKRMDRSATRE